jgi:hypothetical protein
MSVVASVLIAFVVLTFGIVTGVLTCISPKHHGEFWRWYSRTEYPAPGVGSGAQIELRIAGIVMVAVCMFLAWEPAK